MAKVAKETEKIFEENLKYIGLNLDKLPTFLKKYEGLNFRPSNSYDDAVYKVYKYVNIKEIEILITPENRLTDIKQRYKLSSPICEYLDSEKEENIEKFARFIKMVSTMDKARIAEINSYMLFPGSFAVVVHGVFENDGIIFGFDRSLVLIDVENNYFVTNDHVFIRNPPLIV